MKVTTQSFYIHLVEEIKIGELTATLVASVSGDKTHYDIDFADLYDISYMGIPISGWENWNKFKKFHLDMGIDFDKRIKELFDQTFTQQSVKKFVSKVNF